MYTIGVVVYFGIILFLVFGYVILFLSKYKQNDSVKIDRVDDLSKEEMNNIYVKHKEESKENQSERNKEKVLDEIKNSRRAFIVMLIVSIIFFVFVIAGAGEESGEDLFHFRIGLIVFFLFFFIVIILTAKKYFKVKKQYNELMKGNPKVKALQKNDSCNNSCIEEGDDIFAEKRESNKKQVRETKKQQNQLQANSGKKFCKHCGAQLLYEDDRRCDWCGELQ